MNKYKPTCVECGEPATYRLCTQFTGDHDLCTKHALEDPSFDKEGDSHHYWVLIEDGDE